MNSVLLKNSLLLGCAATLLAALLGLAAALCLMGLPRAWRNRVLALTLMALALPPFVVTNCWLDLASLLPGLSLIYSLPAAAWLLGLMLWPIPCLAAWAAWQRLESDHLRCDMAVRGWHLLRGLLLPLAATTLLPGAAVTFVLALNNFAVPAILQVKVFPAEIWIRFTTLFDTAGAFQMSWPLIVFPLMLLFWLRNKPFPWPRTQQTICPTLFRQQLGKPWFRASAAVTVCLLFLSLGLPLLELVSARRTWTELPGALAAGHSAAWTSFWLAATTATLVTALAIAWHRLLRTPDCGVRASDFKVGSSRPFTAGHSPALGFFLHPSGFVFRTLLWLPFLVPGVLLGITLIAVFNRPSLAVFYQSVTIVLFAFVLRYLAVGSHPVGRALHELDPNLNDAARLDGANRWQLFRRIEWPQIAPRAFVAWYIVFLLCLWDVESIVLIYPPGGETLALRVFNLLHYGHNPQVNALCLVLLALAVAPLAILHLSRKLRPTRHALSFAGAALGVLACSGCSQSETGEVRLRSEIFESVRSFGTRGAGLGQFNKPRSVAVDSGDNFYAVDMTGRVQKFSPSGEFLTSWQMPQTDLGKPKGMCRGQDGEIIVIEPHYQRVNHFSPDGKLLLQWGRKGVNEGEFTLPRAVAVNSHGELYVSEYGASERVQRFAPGGTRLLTCFGRPGNAPGEFNRPEGLCVDQQDRVYVADSCNHRIQIFSREGKFLRTYGKAGSGRGELSYPYDIAVDAAGRQYVCEFGNSRIQVFDANDQPREIIGSAGTPPGRFNNPWGLALDSNGSLYVADSQNHCVQKLMAKARPKYLLTWNAEP